MARGFLAIVSPRTLQKCFVLAPVITGVSFVTFGATDLSAQQVQARPAASDAKAKEVAQKAYADGVRAYERRQYDKAMKNVTTALARGGLPNSQMAKALLIRGVVYRKRKKPAQAISDLTTALWLKGGLNDTDRQVAEKAREAAYKEVGLTDAPPIAFLPSQASRQNAAGPTPSSSRTVEPPKPTPGAKVARATPNSVWNFVPQAPSLGNLLPTFGSSTEKKPAAAPAPAATPAVAAQQSTPTSPVRPGATAPTAAKPAPEFFNWETSTTGNTQLAANTQAGVAQAGGAVGSPAAATAVTQPASNFTPPVTSPAAAPTTTVRAPQQQQNIFTSGVESVSNFFGNIFSAPSTAQTTTVSPRPTSTSSWQTSTNTSAGSVIQTNSVTPRVKREIPTTGGGGIYRLQVAVSNTREEAQRIAQAVAADPAVQRVGMSPQVDQATYGNMGSFYRVRIGPFADALRPNEVCKGLRPKGYDCAVVTR